MRAIEGVAMGARGEPAAHAADDVTGGDTQSAADHPQAAPEAGGDDAGGAASGGEPEQRHEERSATDGDGDRDEQPAGHASQFLPRRAAATLVPRGLVEKQKTPRLTPPIDISRHFREEVVTRVSCELRLSPPRLKTDDERVLWTTIGLLLRAILEGT